ncbi:MAG TPA: MaoC family dehydratase [Dehalococcoidia bacterium]|nr:MaoC family dehydratase [Dehalococcoidia bacterium]
MQVKVGDTIPDWVMESVAPERMRTMAAILRDPNPVHWDRKTVAKLGYGDHTINQGPLGLSYMVNMLHAWAGPTCLKRLVMRFPMAVLDGDHIVAKGEVTDMRDEDGERVAECRVWLERKGTDPPLEGEATVRLA